MKSLAALLLLAAGCSVIFPETSVAIEKLPVGFWENLSDLASAVGSDIYLWVSTIIGLAL